MQSTLDKVVEISQLELKNIYSIENKSQYLHKSL